MTTSNFIHWSGAFAISGGISTLIMAYGMAFMRESPPKWGSLLYLALFLSMPIALVGIYLHQKETAGSFGLIAFLVALAGVVFLIARSDLGASVLALGLILVSVSLLRAASFPIWVPWLWIAAMVLYLLGTLLNNSQPSISFILLATIVFSLGFLGAGYTLWTHDG